MTNCVHTAHGRTQKICCLDNNCSFSHSRQAPDSETLLMPISSVSHVSDRMELHNNNWASGSQHAGLSESDVIQEAQSNDLLHTARLSMRQDTPLHGNNARGTKYTVYYASVVTHTVFENINWLCSELCRITNLAVPSPASLFPVHTCVSGRARLALAYNLDAWSTQQSRASNLTRIIQSNVVCILSRDKKLLYYEVLPLQLKGLSVITSG